MKPDDSTVKKQAVLQDQKMKISSTGVGYSNINDLWDLDITFRILGIQHQSLALESYPPILVSRFNFENEKISSKEFFLLLLRLDYKLIIY